MILDASGSRDADGKPVANFAWDVDGVSGTTESTSSRIGPYTATGTPARITVTDSFGCTASLAQEIRVGHRPEPVATFTRGGRTICAGESVVIDCLASTSADGGPPAGCNWDLEGNPGIDHHGQTTPAFVPEEGKEIRMSVQDPSGCSANLYLTFDVREPPSVDAGPDRRVGRGELVDLGTPGGPGYAYGWTCDNWSCGLSDATAPEPWALPEGNTAYTLTVSDGVCTVTDTALVTVGPRVIATTPADGETWFADGKLWLRFDSAMDRNSFNGNVRLLDAQTGNAASISTRWDGGTKSLVVTPTGLVSGRAYLLEVDGGDAGVRSAASDTLHADHTLAFTAGPPGDGVAPRVAYKQPTLGATGVLPTTDVVVTFDEPLDPGSVGAGTFYISGVPAEVSYDPRSWTATLKPLDPLARGATYRVEVRGIRDVSGAAADFSWQFTTGNTLDTTPPRAIGAQPAAGASAVDPFSPATVGFDEAIDASSLAGIRLIDDTSGMPVAAEVFWDEENRLASLVPRQLLSPGSRYRLEVAGIRDQAGNVMGGVLAHTFTTQDALLVENFEGALAGWSTSGAWGIDTDATYAGNAGLSDSPDACGCTDAAATTPPIDVGGKRSVVVSYWSRQSLATDGSDAAHLEYSLDGGTWIPAASLSGPAGWQLRSHVIDTGSRSSQLQLRFRLDVDGAANLDGWFVDQLLVR
ncbi:Ig-like domain-containing protein [Vulgatibacter sp.]|uniref:Ig-like domain-containing protein n=1 Tax=Vulgatibacter sp. TaxID=1971226 RepID=UPI003567671D